jgi:hypothetical protein
MSIGTEKPTKPFGRVTPGRQRQMTQAVTEAWSRANRRKQMAEIAAIVPGSLETKRLAVVRAMERGVLPPGAVPSKSTIKYLKERWEQGDKTLEDYMEAPRTGRPAVLLAGLYQAEVDRVIEGGYGTTAHELLLRFKGQAGDAVGRTVPTYHLVHKQFAAAGRLKRAAARHGSRAGVVDGAPKGRVSTKHTHDLWAIDELTLPIWVGMYSDKLGRWISARCDLILIIDVRSTYPVGYYVADPSRRTTPDGHIRESGFDSNDVLAALLSAACPELAPDATREGAGFLPNCIQWDNHQVHKAIEAQFKAARIDVEFRRIPVRHAFRNGAVERPNGVVKTWFSGCDGHLDDYLPTDRLTQDKLDQGLLRAERAGSSPDRESRKLTVLPEQLPRVGDVREIVDEVMRRYGHEHVRTLFRQTAISRYHSQMARRTPRRGRELLRLLETDTTTVKDAGIQYVADGCRYDYLAVIDHALLMDGKPVTYAADPVNRGIFVFAGHKTHFLAPQPTGDELLARKLTHSRYKAARQISDRAKMERDADFILSQGKRALEHATEGALREKAAFQAQARGEEIPPPVIIDDTPPAGRRLEPAHSPQPEVVPDESDDPWKVPDPAAFVRGKRPFGPASTGGSDD